MNHRSAQHLTTKFAGTHMVHIPVNVNQGIIMSVACVKVLHFSVNNLCVQCRYASLFLCFM